MKTEELLQKVQLVLALLQGLSMQEAVNVLFSVIGEVYRQNSQPEQKIPEVPK